MKGGSQPQAGEVGKAGEQLGDLPQMGEDRNQGRSNVQDQNEARRSCHRQLQRKDGPSIGYSASSASSDKGDRTRKRPNPSFRGVRRDCNQSEGQTRQQGGLTSGEEERMDTRGLNWEGWVDREQRRGYDSSPNTSEFSDLNDLSIA
jgi:hypothetical protein